MASDRRKYWLRQMRYIQAGNYALLGQLINEVATMEAKIEELNVQLRHRNDDRAALENELAAVKEENALLRGAGAAPSVEEVLRRHENRR